MSERRGQIYGINIPTDSTFKRYGLSFHDWLDIIELDVSVEQGVEYWACPVCGKPPKDGKTNIDHFHVRGWKKMKPRDRKKYVRGIVCAGCNYFVLSRHLTAEKAKGAARYLARFEERRHV